MDVSNYRQLKVWQTGIKLVKEVYLMPHTFPKHEVYGLSSQMQRAAVSIPANLAEGHARAPTREFLRHVSIAYGSLAELETHIILAESLDYCGHDQSLLLLDTCQKEGKMLNGLRRSLERKCSSQ